MNRGVWISGLFLSLCGWVCQAEAQEVIWRPATRPADPLPRPRFQAVPAVAAAIGRPTPLKGVPPEAGAPGGVIAASYRVIASPRPVARTVPDGLDALDVAPPADAAPVPAPPPAIAGSGLGFPGPAPAAAPVPVANFTADLDAGPVVFASEPTTTEPITVEPKAGPATTETEAAPALASPPPEAEAGPAVDAPDLIQNLESWRPHFYVRSEYLRWAVKKDTVPPLVTTSTNSADNGILGAKTTQVLFGGDGLNGGGRSGARFTGGLWLDDCESKGIEISGFFLGNKTETFDANSTQFPLLARPFFSENRNAEFAQLTAHPNDETGNIAVRDTSDLWGMEANFRCCLCCGQQCPDDCDGHAGWHYRVDGLAGFRYLNLSEDLSITENIRNFPTPQNKLMNLGLMVFDDFATHNQFYGAQVGLDGTVDFGPWSLNATGKLALGDTHQEVSIHGSQLVTNLNGTISPANGGLLALPSNSGTFRKEAFTVVPEVDLTVSYHVSDHVRLFAGFDFLYWSSVVRPGQQIDRTLDETQIPNFEPPGTVAPAGQNRPAVLFQRSDFWAQGLNLGLEFRF